MEQKTKRVKILLCEEFSDDDYSRTIVREGISDWEEITMEEYNFLREHLTGMYSPKWPYRAALVCEDEVPVRERIAGIKKAIDVHKAKVEKERKIREEAQAQRAAAKELKKRAKTEDAEKKLFEELQKKFGNKKSLTVAAK